MGEDHRTIRAGQAQRAWARHVVWLPIPLIALAAAALYRLDSRAVFESTVLLATLSAIFRTSTSLLIAYLAARTYLVAGSRAVLALGCGALTFGIASSLASLLMADQNVALTVHNSGLLLAGACFLLSSVWAVRGKPGTPSAPPLRAAALPYLAVSAAMGLLLWGALAGALPHFRTAQGFTALRQGVLGLAVVEFAVASLCSVILYGRSRTAFLKWYGAGLALIGMGVLVIIVEGSLGTALSWVGRLSQFLGGLYMLIGIMTVAEGRWGWEIPLEQALYESEERYQALLEAFRALADNLPDNVDRLDRGYRHLYVNPAAARAFGMTPDQVIGKTNRELGVSDPSAGVWEERVRQVFETGQPLDFEDQLPTPDGLRYFHTRCVAERALDGTVATVLAVSRDTTARRQAEAERERLLASERHAREEAEAALRLRDEFLSVAAHELKTPITSLRGYAQLLVRRIDRGVISDAQQTRASLQVIDREADRITRLEEQFLDISRLQGDGLALERRVTDIAGLAREVVETMRVANGSQSLHLQAPAHLIANVDPLRVDQVLTNLIDNAIRFGPDESAVEIDVSGPDPATIRIAVRDYGPGIPPEERGRLFSRYHRAGTRRPAGGLGLSLYISRQIVEAHGGHIDAEFPPDGGTRFVVTLPRSLSDTSTESNEGTR